MSQRGRSARTRPQRLARRRASIQGFDRGGNRRSWLRSRWVLGTFGIVAAAALIAGLIATGFGDPAPAPTADPPPVRRTGSEVVTGAVAGKPTWDAPPAFALSEGVDYGAEIKLESGELITLDLFEGASPQHVNNFVFLARAGFYNELTFHEVLPGDRVRAGDPTAGDPGVDWPADAGYTLPDEPLTGANEAALSTDVPGIVSMWRDDSGASSSQFVISLAEGSGLTEGATAFGQVTEGLDQLYAFDSRDPAAIPTPPTGPKIVAIRISENGVVAQAESTEAAEPAESTESAGIDIAPVPDLSLSWDEPPEFALEDGIDYRATIEMVGGGVIEIDLYEDIAPQHVNNFIFLARQSFYDAVTFHRIIHGFMAQGGDPTGFGSGGPGYSIDAEFNDTKHVRGVLSAARSADPNSAGSQFFIVYDAAPHLDGQYTAFGEVISGMDIVDAFPERNPADPTEPPGPQIATITISEIAQDE